ncbi:hypothetical protein L1987_73243 [Smallanthus sonchifolius]|uniref:Uncharacterized protein n=1 Tax=Smallanthus sonchifolius TaxID=185202 RepID=A0ACB9A0C3_9ASTR|nr:hypothetical protein L1987_73243 [Smallanthus sonchifolius]
MNTVISAMALNYPSGKLSVYLSDDGACPVTLQALGEAWKFAKMWVPFCEKYGVETICPADYFAGQEVCDELVVDSDEYGDEKVRIKEEYKSFARKMTKISESESCISNKDHPAVVEVMVDENTHDQKKMPLLLRVSSSLSNSPYILGLDCDMHCNDRNSARQAMCFHLDPKLSSSLAFVQFPQTFHNISKHDIYKSELRYFFKTFLQGMDGIKGPGLCGTCYYLKREALFGPPSLLQDINLNELKQSFGSSNEFIKSLHNKRDAKLECGKALCDELLQEAKLLASCEYENDTKWGKEVGFRYFTVVEDFLTSFNMHCKQWVSVLYMSSRPSF